MCVEFYKSLCVMFCKKGEADIVCNVVQICGGVLLLGEEFRKLCGKLPPRPGPGQADDNGWMDGCVEIFILVCKQS